MSRGCSSITVLLALQIYLPRLNSVFIKAFLNLKTSISGDQMQQANKFINLPVCMNINLCVCSAQWKHTHTTTAWWSTFHTAATTETTDCVHPTGWMSPQSASLHWLNITFTPQTLLSDATHNKSIQPPQEQGTRVWTALRGLRAVCKYSFMSWDQRGPVVSGEELLTSSNFGCKLSIIFTSFNCSNLKTVQINLENSSKPKDIQRKQAWEVRTLKQLSDNFLLIPRLINRLIISAAVYPKPQTWTSDGMNSGADW